MDEPARKPGLRFSLRTLLEVVAVAALVLALIYSNAWLGADRYELHVVQQANKSAPIVFMLDKRTGRMWVRVGSSTGAWLDSGPRP